MSQAWVRMVVIDGTQVTEHNNIVIILFRKSMLIQKSIYQTVVTLCKVPLLRCQDFLSAIGKPPLHIE